jgi:hypothetical protein
MPNSELQKAKELTQELENILKNLNIVELGKKLNIPLIVNLNETLDSLIVEINMIMNYSKENQYGNNKI